jgi:hypothetical protein
MTQFRAGRRRAAPASVSVPHARLPEAASSRGWGHSEALEVRTHATWSPRPRRHPRTALSTGPLQVPLRARRSRPLAVLRVKAGVSRRGEGTFSLPTYKIVRGRPSSRTLRARRP